MLVDSHCHLDFDRFKHDRAEVLGRARETGVRLIVNPGYDLESSQRAVALAGKHPMVYAAVGVHPHRASTVSGGAIKVLRRLAAAGKVQAIGEIGLDYYRNLSPPDVQRRAFREQLELAGELGLPVIVHSRESHGDVISMLARWVADAEPQGGSSSIRGVLHAFSGNREVAQDALRLGFCLGIAGPVTFRSARRLRTLVASLPLEHLLVETDAPYLTPHPHRGKRNEPARVALVAAAVAELQGIDFLRAARQTTATARRLFGLPAAAASPA
jgi:TatD DNase family protein